MQPANTTALSVSETVRSLNSGSKGKAGGMVTFRTRLRLMGSGWKAGEAVAAHATGGGGGGGGGGGRGGGGGGGGGGAWLMSTIRPFFTRKRYQAHAISLLMCAHPCLFRLVDEVLFLFHFQRFGFV
ncbi:hypothetical protein SAMN02744133_107155 [Thalassospira xiamenensis M-5 = DSM 17429]|nr:hypothetical protein SAMN02744133_107155 [Thalassospira xiamenensis M-5 = DSM 17429]